MVVCDVVEAQHFMRKQLEREGLAVCNAKSLRWDFLGSLLSVVVVGSTQPVSLGQLLYPPLCKAQPGKHCICRLWT